MRLRQTYRPLGLFMLGIVTYVTFKTLFFSSAGPDLELDPELVLAIRRLDQTSSPLLSTTTGKPDPCSLDALAVIPATARRAGCTDCQEMTCKAMLFSNRTAEVFKSTRAWMKAHPVSLEADEIFINLTQNCDQYRVAHRYHTEPPGDEEANFPIAYNIIMHRDVPQIERVLRAIYRPQNEYCIHIDAKQKPVIHNAMKGIANCFPNIHIATKQERIVYAGFSRLQADINCMDDLLNKVTTKWKYLINIAGQSFPLKTNLEMVQTLKVYNGSNDIEGIFGHRILRGRFENEWVEINTNTSRPGIKKTKNKNPKPPYEIDIVRGSAYGIFSRGFVDFIINNKKAKALLEWSKKTWSPDEHYWATLHHLYTNPHLKTPGGYPGKPDVKPWLAVFAAWGGRDKCEGMWKHGVCVFGVADIGPLILRREFFANKFYMTFQPFALDCIEEWLEYKVKCPPKFDEKYYSSLPYVGQNLRPWENRS